MKRLILTSITILICIASKAQYSMITQFETYHDLIDPILLNNDEIWDESSTYQVYFDFDFKIYGQTYNALNLYAGGGISFPGLGEKRLFIYHTPFGGYMLKDKGGMSSTSSINYEITGEAGDHILKLEWNNAGFVQWFSSSNPTDYVDVQIWLFESDNHMEIHFGDSQTTPGTYGYPVDSSNYGPSIKFRFDSCENVLCPLGAADLPSYDFLDLCSPAYPFIDGTPSKGIIYNFIPIVTSSAEDLDSELITLFPNPFTEQIILTFSEKQINTKLTLYDSFGLMVKELYTSGTQQIIEKGILIKGTYFLRIDNGKHIHTRKIILN